MKITEKTLSGMQEMSPRERMERERYDRIEKILFIATAIPFTIVMTAIVLGLLGILR